MLMFGFALWSFSLLIRMSALRLCLRLTASQPMSSLISYGAA
jgi:hypothetical protein